MTRRGLFCMLATGWQTEPKLVVPVHRVMDRRTQCTDEQFRSFWRRVWPEAVRVFDGGGVQLQCTDATGEIRRSPADNPIFVGLRPGVINLVLTDHIPLAWDKSRALAGVSTLHEGYAICSIALRYAHGNQIPFVSVNTCVHELLHALLLDIFLSPQKGLPTMEHEFRADWYATLLWLFHDGAGPRRSGEACLRRLRFPSG